MRNPEISAFYSKIFQISYQIQLKFEILLIFKNINSNKRTKIIAFYFQVFLRMVRNVRNIIQQQDSDHNLQELRSCFELTNILIENYRSETENVPHVILALCQIYLELDINHTKVLEKLEKMKESMTQDGMVPIFLHGPLEQFISVCQVCINLTLLNDLIYYIFYNVIEKIGSVGR